MPAVFPLHIQEMVVFSWISFPVFLYLTITVCGMFFQTTSSQPAKLYQAPHLNCISAAIRFALFRFYSPLLTESQLLSPPPLTKMLQSSGFLILSNHWPKPVRCRIQRSRVQRLLAPSPGLSQLARIFINLESWAIHLLAYCSDPTFCLWRYHWS